MAAAVPSYRVIDTIRRIAVAEPHEETPLHLQAFGPPSAHPGIGVRPRGGKLIFTKQGEVDFEIVVRVSA